MPPAVRRYLRMKSGRTERRARRNTARIDLLQNLRLSARSHQPTKLKSSATTNSTCPRAVVYAWAHLPSLHGLLHAQTVGSCAPVKSHVAKSKLCKIEARTVGANPMY